MKRSGIRGEASRSPPDSGLRPASRLQIDSRLVKSEVLRDLEITEIPLIISPTSPPIPLPPPPLKGEESYSLPFKGRVRVGVGWFLILCSGIFMWYFGKFQLPK